MRLEEDARLIPRRSVVDGVTEERYVVDAMTVVLTIEQGVVVGAECECEEFAKNQTNVMMQTLDEQKCRHVREAEMFTYYERKVTPVEEEPTTSD